MPHIVPLHPTAHRREVSSLPSAAQARMRQLLDIYIATQNPVGEHLAAANNMALEIHGAGFIAWHAVFLAKLENWLAVNGGGEFVPLPIWYPGTPVPASLDRGNNGSVNVPFPDRLRPGPIVDVPSYEEFNSLTLGYHASVHNQLGGQMPFPTSSPSDPIFYAFHAFLLAVYEHWRSH